MHLEKKYTFPDTQPQYSSELEAAIFKIIYKVGKTVLTACINQSEHLKWREIQYLGSKQGISKKRADKVLISITRKEMSKLSGTNFVLHCVSVCIWQVDKALSKRYWDCFLTAYAFLKAIDAQRVAGDPYNIMNASNKSELELSTAAVPHINN